MFRRTALQPTLFLTSNLLPGEMVQRLENDWPGQFRHYVLPLVDEEQFSKLYHADNGRPNTPVRLLIGVLVLKEIFNLTDEEALGRLAFDLRWHVALERALGDAPCCQKTLHNFRVALEKHDLAKAQFRELTGKMIEALGLSVEKQRLDSTHILSNIARLNRLGLFCETIRVFLKELRKEMPGKFVEVPEGLRGRYLKNDGGEQPYQDARKEDAPRRLKVCARDLWRLLERFRQDGAVQALPSHGLVGRLFSEQCEIPEVMPVVEPGDADATEPPVAVGLKEPKDISAASLQSPHDPDVTYSGHKGKGYEVQLAETHGNGEKPELFTHVEVTPSCKSDEAAAIPVLEALSQAGLQPSEMAADTTYGSAANAQAYEDRGTELVSPVRGPEAQPLAEGQKSVADFKLDGDGEGPVVCPAGYEAPEVLRSKTGRVHARYSAEQCGNCPLRCGCPTRQNKDGTRSLHTDRKAYLLEKSLVRKLK